MSSDDTDTRLTVFLVTTLLIVGPWFYFTLPSPFKNESRQNEARATNPYPSLPFAAVAQSQLELLERRRLFRSFNSLLIAANTVYILYSLIVNVPPNVYLSYDLPLGTSGDTLRQLMLATRAMRTGEALPADVEKLLVKLNDAWMRTAYSSFGHDALVSCSFCTTFDDYALYSLSSALLSFLMQAFVVGFVTTRASGGNRWRKWGISALAIWGAAEVYIMLVATADVSRMDVSATMWHDRRQLVRHIVFLLLPPILHFLPQYPLQSSPLSALPQIVTLLEMTNARMYLLKYAHGATLRAPSLRDESSAWWRREHLEGLWAREDEGVKEVAEKLSLSYEDGEKIGRLRVNARAAIEALRAGFEPSVHLNP